MLTVEEVKEYQSIHRRLFQCEISAEEAAEQGTRLVVLLETIFKQQP